MNLPSSHRSLGTHAGFAAGPKLPGDQCVHDTQHIVVAGIKQADSHKRSATQMMRAVGPNFPVTRNPPMPMVAASPGFDQPTAKSSPASMPVALSAPPFLATKNKPTPRAELSPGSYRPVARAVAIPTVGPLPGPIFRRPAAQRCPETIRRRINISLTTMHNPTPRECASSGQNLSNDHRSLGIHSLSVVAVQSGLATIRLPMPTCVASLGPQSPRRPNRSRHPSDHCRRGLIQPSDQRTAGAQNAHVAGPYSSSSGSSKEIRFPCDVPLPLLEHPQLKGLPDD